MGLWEPSLELSGAGEVPQGQGSSASLVLWTAVDCYDYDGYAGGNKYTIYQHVQCGFWFGLVLIFINRAEVAIPFILETPSLGCLRPQLEVHENRIKICIQQLTLRAVLLGTPPGTQSANNSAQHKIWKCQEQPNALHFLMSSDFP